jgi:hypothetical protein
LTTLDQKLYNMSGPLGTAVLRPPKLHPTHQASNYNSVPKEITVSFQKSFIVKIVFLSLLSVVFAGAASAQVPNGTPMMIIEKAKPPLAVAGKNNLYCAGFIQTTPISTGNRVIGGQDEADKFLYAQNDFIYINMGRDKGVNIGDLFSVVRPRGEVNSKWSRKHDIGFYVQEVGLLEVVNVKQEVAVARVKTSCDNLLLGDLVQLVPPRVSPVFVRVKEMNRFGDASGKATGRILMSRDGAEAITRDYIVYVDLGADDNVNVGDRLTIFRPLAKGNVTTHSQKEGVTSRDYGFQSEVYKGGKFSNQSGRKSGDRATGNEVTSKMAKKGRPDWLRKVVGEGVVLNVKEKTATVVITRTGQEIHTGDWVELQ